jgi:hypothetical protein
MGPEHSLAVEPNVGRAPHREGEGLMASLKHRGNSLGFTVEPLGSSDEVMIERLIPTGRLVRIQLLSRLGERRFAELPRHEVDELELQAGEILFVAADPGHPATP